jgi:D-sedoheptulose 7-phosphate isomerase
VIAQRCAFAAVQRYPVLQTCEQELISALDLLVAAYQAGHKLLICGNGGSAADSEHMVAELMKGFRKCRPISSSHAAQLEAVNKIDGKSIALRLQGALPAISLAAPISLTSAVANDIDFD